MNKPLKEFSEVELKSFIYDLNEEAQKLAGTIKVIRQELERRKATKEKPNMEETNLEKTPADIALESEMVEEATV
jgi:hypothetical protein